MRKSRLLDSQLWEAHPTGKLNRLSKPVEFWSYQGAYFLLNVSAGVIQMSAMMTSRYLDKLTKRRGQIMMTLRHLANEQRQVEQNTDWLDQAAYESRVNLLDRLRDWYTTEIGQIDKAIERIESNRYGQCVACYAAIEEARLEKGPGGGVV